MPTTPLTVGFFNFMTHKLDLLGDMLDGSQYDPVIWEDVLPSTKLYLLTKNLKNHEN